MAAGVPALVSGSAPLAPTQAPTWVPDALTLLNALRYRWQLALILGLIGGSIATLAAWIWLPTPKAMYRAAALIRIASTEPRLVFPTMMTEGADFNTFRHTQAELLRSRFILQTALREPRVAELTSVREDPEVVLRWMERDLRVEFLEGSEILRLSLTGTEPSELTVLVNAIKDTYMREVVATEFAKRQARLEFLERTYSEQARNLAERWKQFPTEPTAIDPLPARANPAIDMERKPLLDQYADYQKRLVQIENDLARTRYRLDLERKKREAQTKQTINPKVIEQALEQDPRLQAAEQQVRVARLRLEHYRKLFARKDDLEEYEEAYNSARKARDELLATLRPQYEERFKEKLQVELPDTIKLQEEIVIQEGEKKWLQEMIKGLSVEVEALRAKSDQTNVPAAAKQPLPSKELEIARLELERLDQQTKFVRDELEATRIEMKAGPRITSIQDAEISPIKDLRKETKLVSTALAGLGTFAFLALGVGWWEFRSGRIHTAADVTRRLGLHLVGSLPYAPEAVLHNPLASDDQPGDVTSQLWTESIDAVRTQLLHESRATPLRVVMVTSALAQEGKTTLAAQLAVHLAAAGRRTLLVDADLARPHLHESLGQAAAPGLCDVLRGQAGVADVVRPTPVPGLWLLTAGDPDRAAQQALARDAIQPILERLKAEFDMLVIDTSPVMPVVTPLLIGKHVDGVLLGLLCEQSRIVPIYAAWQRLRALDLRVLGAVVSCAPVSSYGQDYFADTGVSL